MYSGYHRAMPVDNDFFPAFSPAEFARRRQAVRAGMREQGLDCLIIYGAYSYAGTDTGSVNVVYLANYAAINHSYLVFPADGEPTLIINNSNHLPNARDIAVIDDVRSGGIELVDGLVARLRELKLDRASVGIVGPLPTWWTHTIPVEHSDKLAQAFPHMQRQTVTPWYENIRLIKSSEEIALMEKAAALTDLAFNELVQATRPGVRHSELRWLIEAVAARGHGKFPFGHISSTPMSDPQQIYPDFYPTHRAVRAGDIAQTELALGYGHYFGKVWGSYFIGEPSAEYRRLFELGAKVHDEAIASLKPGMSGSDVNRWMERFKGDGYVAANAAPLVNGWSSYNHAPHFGAIAGTPDAKKRAYPKDLEFVLQPGHCVGIRSYPIAADGKTAVWMGTTCVMTGQGLRKLHACPVNKINVAPA
jgi:Xaa-Pro aminopeptidase